MQLPAAAAAMAADENPCHHEFFFPLIPKVAVRLYSNFLSFSTVPVCGLLSVDANDTQGAALHILAN